jgi:uncharacterized membrane protein
MTRAEFIERLRRGLKGVPSATAADIVADYERYFADGIQAGRTEEQLALALGNPSRLAAELRLESEVAGWQASRTRAAAVRTVAAVLGLVALDGLLLLALALMALLVAAGFLLAAIAVLYGAFTLTFGLFDEPAGGLLAAILRGIGRAAGGIAGIASCVLITGLLADMGARYARTHRRVLRPRAGPSTTAGSSSHDPD